MESCWRSWDRGWQGAGEGAGQNNFCKKLNPGAMFGWIEAEAWEVGSRLGGLCMWPGGKYWDLRLQKQPGNGERNTRRVIKTWLWWRMEARSIRKTKDQKPWWPKHSKGKSGGRLGLGRKTVHLICQKLSFCCSRDDRRCLGLNPGGGWGWESGLENQLTEQSGRRRCGAEHVCKKMCDATEGMMPSADPWGSCMNGAEGGRGGREG